jgi:uncharacterized protein (DUF433 family)
VEHSKEPYRLSSMAKPRIISDPDIMVGQPVIEGTRITVHLILEELALGQSIDDILRSFPHLSREGVQAAIDFACELVDTTRVYPVQAA